MFLICSSHALSLLLLFTIFTPFLLWCILFCNLWHSLICYCYFMKNCFIGYLLFHYHFASINKNSLTSLLPPSSLHFILFPYYYSRGARSFYLFWPLICLLCSLNSFFLLLLFCEEQSSLELCLLFHWHFASIDRNSLFSLSMTSLYFYLFLYCCSRGKRFVSHFCAFNVSSLLFAFIFFVVICSCLFFFPFAILLFSFVCLFSRYYKWCFGFKFNIKSPCFHFMVSFNIVFLPFKKFPFVIFFKLQIILVHIDFYFLVISTTQDC